MGWRAALARVWGPTGTVPAPGEAGARTTGRPTSSNRASSFHLEWLWPGPAPRLREVGVTLTVVDGPQVPALYFWALQVSFLGPGGQRFGGAHTGLQHHPGHPGATAVNWGGYDAGGHELAGSASPLPSATGNRNTRDWSWAVGAPTALRVRRGAEGWVASVDGVDISEVHVGGDHLGAVMVWSEVFAACDDPSVTVRWSDAWGLDDSGRLVRPGGLRTRYQAVAAGGCSNTVSVPDGAGGVLQRTSTPRRVPAGTVLPLG